MTAHNGEASMAENPDPLLLHHLTTIAEALKGVNERLDGVNERFDTLNGRTRSVEQKVAVLEDRADNTHQSARSVAKWGAAIGAALSALIAGLMQTLGGGK